jgi:hypothetical protein
MRALPLRETSVRVDAPVRNLIEEKVLHIPAFLGRKAN